MRHCDVNMCTVLVRHDKSVSEVSAQVLQVATKAVENALFVDNLLSFMEKTYMYVYVCVLVGNAAIVTILS